MDNKAYVEVLSKNIVNLEISRGLCTPENESTKIDYYKNFPIEYLADQLNTMKRREDLDKINPLTKKRKFPKIKSKTIYFMWGLSVSGVNKHLRQLSKVSSKIFYDWTLRTWDQVVLGVTSKFDIVNLQTSCSNKYTCSIWHRPAPKRDDDYFRKTLGWALNNNKEGLSDTMTNYLVLKEINRLPDEEAKAIAAIKNQEKPEAEDGIICIRCGSVEPKYVRTSEEKKEYWCSMCSLIFSEEGYKKILEKYKGKTNEEISTAIRKKSTRRLSSKLEEMRKRLKNLDQAHLKKFEKIEEMDTADFTWQQCGSCKEWNPMPLDGDDYLCFFCGNNKYLNGLSVVGPKNKNSTKSVENKKYKKK